MTLRAFFSPTKGKLLGVLVMIILFAPATYFLVALSEDASIGVVRWLSFAAVALLNPFQLSIVVGRLAGVPGLTIILSLAYWYFLASCFTWLARRI